VAGGKTFRWAGRYSWDLNSRETLDTQLNVFAGFEPDLPAAYRETEIVFLANIDPVLQRRVLEQVTRPKLVACDTMNFWIEGKPEELKKTLAQVDVLVINDGEARELAREHNLVKAARIIRALGPKALIVKRGEYGALLFDDQGVFAAPAFPLEDVFDPTGAGDAFAGGFMGSLCRERVLDPHAIRRAVIYGSVLASFAVEDFSLDRLRRLTMAEVVSRFMAFQALTAFTAVPADSTDAPT
jgi:sugar/nucleoside kinase (ribokinase family)